MCIRDSKIPSHKYGILQILCSLAAGFLGFFLTGAIGVDGSAGFGSSAKLGIKATGGAAIFVVVFLRWRPDKRQLRKVFKKMDQLKVGVADISTRQQQQVTRVDLEGTEERLQKSIDELKIACEDPTKRRLPQELIEKAKVLLELGNKEQQALAQIALKNYAAADHILHRPLFI